MATELGKAYVQIVPSAEGISGSISNALGGEATSAGKSAGLNIAGAIKGAIAAAGIGTLIKDTLSAGGDLQQSFGGLDTIYGDAAEAAKQYASEAAKAGISANDYAEQAVSFGASLKQAFEGDTVQAVEAANVAIMDMADNSAKMGTDISAVQSAYQGFAKQNYTMLDNLKLGYGGTKTEMERLLKDAEELSGVEYNIDNLGDVYSAIHVIQDDLGLTGVAAAEAEETFTGSFGAMKAAAQNLMANLALGNDITKDLDVLMGNAEAFVMKNLAPMLKNIFGAIPSLIEGFSSMIIGGLNIVSSNAGEIVQLGIDIVVGLVNAIVSAAPYLVEAAFNLAVALGDALISTDWLAIGTDLMNSLSESLSLASGEIFGSDADFLTGFFDSITAALPEVLNKGVEIITNLANGILENLPQLITVAGELVTQFANFLITNAPMLLNAGVDLLLNLTNGIINNLPQIATTAITVITDLAANLLSHAPELILTGFELLGKLTVGIIECIPKLIAELPKIFSTIKDSFSKYDWKQIGIDILLGIKNGILGAIDKVVEAAKDAAGAIWDTVKGFFDIESPSKLMAYAGEMIDAGLAGGILNNQGLVTEAVNSLNNGAVDALSINPQYNGFMDTTLDQKVDALVGLISNYLPMIADKETSVTLEGDADRLFRVMQREAVRNKQLTGVALV